MKKFFILLAIIVFTISSGFTGKPEENKAVYRFTVDTTADTNDSDLSNGICADSQNKCSLRAAIQQINALPTSSDSISLPAGNYYLNSGLPVLMNPLTLEGSGASGLNPTLITTTAGLTSGLTLQSNSMIRGVKIQNFANGIWVSKDNPVFENCVINGNIKGINIVGGVNPINVTIRTSTIKENTKGIWMEGGTAATNLTLEQTHVFGNENDGLGCGSGARIRGNSVLSAQNSDFYENINDGNGGALCTESGGSIYLNSTNILQNSAGNRGGAIYINNGILTMRNGTTITQNSATDGGGIYIYEGDLIAESSVDAISISNNVASNAYGGIFINRNSITHEFKLDNVIISANQAPQHGGITFEHSGLFTIINSTIKDNVSYYLATPTPLEGDGGGLFIDCTECLTRIVNTTFSANISSRNGGGIALKQGGMLLDNVTITGNIADSDNSGTIKGSGGGIYNESGTLSMRNTLVAGNEDRTASMIIQGYDIDGEIRALGYNLIGGCDWLCTLSSSGSGNLIGTYPAKINPLIGPLTNDVDSTRYDQLFHTLLEGSPAVNAGNPTGCTGLNDALLTDDQAARIRPRFARCDIGAYESSLDTQVEPTLNKIYLPLLTK